MVGLQRLLARDDRAAGGAAGFRLTTYAETNDGARRVEIHRASWESRTFTLESFTRLQQTWPYRADLDVLVVGPDGTHVASVLAWFDERAGLGEFEPVGTHPAFRQQGIARAASLFAMQRLKALGATSAAVSRRGDDDYPISSKLYASVGFRRVFRDIPIRHTTCRLLVAPIDQCRSGEPSSQVM